MRRLFNANMAEPLHKRLERLRSRLSALKLKPAASPSATATAPPHHTVHEDLILSNYALRDTMPHETDLADVGDYDIATIYVTNMLDKPVTVQVYGSHLASTIKSARIGAAFKVAAGDVEARSISVYSETWTQYMYCVFQAEEAPTLGALSVLVQKRVG